MTTGTFVAFLDLVVEPCGKVTVTSFLKIPEVVASGVDTQL